MAGLCGRLPACKGQMTPVASSFKITEPQLLSHAKFDPRHARRDLAGYELVTASGTLMIKEDSIASIDVVALTVIHRHPVGIDLGGTVGTPRMERSCFSLWSTSGPCAFQKRRRIASRRCNSSRNGSMTMTNRNRDIVTSLICLLFLPEIRLLCEAHQILRERREFHSSDDCRQAVVTQVGAGRGSLTSGRGWRKEI